MLMLQATCAWFYSLEVRIPGGDTGVGGENRHATFVEAAVKVVNVNVHLCVQLCWSVKWTGGYLCCLWNVREPYFPAMYPPRLCCLRVLSECEASSETSVVVGL